MLRGLAHALDVVLRHGVERRRVVLEKHLAEPVDATERRSQIVSHRVVECLELQVRCFCGLARSRTWASARLRSEMSRAAIDAPASSPPPSRIGDTVTETSMSLPSLRRRTVSNGATASPFARRAISGCSSAFTPGGRSSDNGRPIDLGGRVAEQTLRAAVPTSDDPRQAAWQ